MAVVRSVKTRLLEGLRRDFVADSDVSGYFTGGVLVGPLTDDPQVLHPPQINIAFLPNELFEPGVGGTSKDIIGVLVKGYFPTEKSNFKVGSVNGHDWMEHLMKIILRGSEDSDGSRGWIKDPDHVGAPTDPLRWLNTAMPDFAEFPSRHVLEANAVLLAFAGRFQTRLDNVTLARTN